MKYTVPINATNGNEHYVDANPALGIEGSIVSAAAIEPVMREVENTITAAGLTPSADDMTQLTQAVKRISANSAGENAIPTYYAGEFKDFFEQTPPAGWAVRDGHVLTNADVNFPALWLELQKPENAWKLKTLAQWNALSTTAGGVGGVPYFVLDVAAKTIKLPDTRTDFLRDANGNVGDWQGDAIRNLSGSFAITTSNGVALRTNSTNGIFKPSTSGPISAATATDAHGPLGVSIDLNGIIPTAPENRPRNIALLGCVCIDPAKAQRNEATTTTPGAVYLADGSGDQRPNAVPSVAMAAGSGMPSGRYINLSLNTTIQNWLVNYIAPSDGYISVIVSWSDQMGSFQRIFTTLYGQSVAGIPQGQGTNNMIPVTKGTLVTIHGTVNPLNASARFIYAQGAY